MEEERRRPAKFLMKATARGALNLENAQRRGCILSTMVNGGRSHEPPERGSPALIQEEYATWHAYGQE
jgi:hypothetical protein